MRTAECHDRRPNTPFLSRGAIGQIPDIVPILAQGLRIVMMEAPPILATNDALLLASIVNAVLLVRSADRDEVRKAKEQLELTSAPVIGAAFNQFDSKVDGRPSQPYHGYYLDPRR